MKEGVRYQMYETADGHILFMASEQEFWKNFCNGIDRADLFEKFPGTKYASHARGNRELLDELTVIFKTKTSVEWMAFGGEFNTPLAPVNTPQTLAKDPQFLDRMPWLPKETHGADMLPIPVKIVNRELADPGMAPTPGQHSDEILGEILGYDTARIAALREKGVLG
jgi:crotonobetainyl-CoA:carnitine CoA-transferase CaiB-like acyl-CoA transferase